MTRMAKRPAPAMPGRSFATNVMNSSAMPCARARRNRRASGAPAQADRRKVRRAEGRDREAATGRTGGCDERPIGSCRARSPAGRKSRSPASVPRWMMSAGKSPPASGTWRRRTRRNGCRLLAAACFVRHRWADGHRRSHGHETARQDGETAQEGGEGAKALHATMMRRSNLICQGRLVTCMLLPADFLPLAFDLQVRSLGGGQRDPGG